MASSAKVNMLGIVGIIGSVLMIIGVFLSWFEISVIFPILGTETYTYSGWDVFSNEIISIGDSLSMDFSDVTDYSYAPVATLACGIIALIATLVATAKPSNTSRIMGIVALILGIVAVALTYMCYGDLSAYVFSEDAILFSVSSSIGAGVWVVIAGAVITIIGGILDLVKKTD